MTELPPDVSWRDVTGDRHRLAGDIFVDGRQYRRDEVARRHEALLESMRETSRQVQARVFSDVFNKEKENG